MLAGECPSHSTCPKNVDPVALLQTQSRDAQDSEMWNVLDVHLPCDICKRLNGSMPGLHGYPFDNTDPPAMMNNQGTWSPHHLNGANQCLHHIPSRQSRLFCNQLSKMQGRQAPGQVPAAAERLLVQHSPSRKLWIGSPPALQPWKQLLPEAASAALPSASPAELPGQLPQLLLPEPQQLQQ